MSTPSYLWSAAERCHNLFTRPDLDDASEEIPDEPYWDGDLTDAIESGDTSTLDARQLVVLAAYMAQRVVPVEPYADTWAPSTFYAGW